MDWSTGGKKRLSSGTKTEISALLNEAMAIIYGDREQTYGDPGKNMAVIAGMWSAYLGVEVTSKDVCNLMICLKVARLRNTPDHHDSKVDIVGYSLLRERVK